MAESIFNGLSTSAYTKAITMANIGDVLGINQLVVDEDKRVKAALDPRTYLEQRQAKIKSLSKSLPDDAAFTKEVEDLMKELNVTKREAVELVLSKYNMNLQMGLSMVDRAFPIELSSRAVRNAWEASEATIHRRGASLPHKRK